MLVTRLIQGTHSLAAKNFPNSNSTKTEERPR